jgi:hypothetical protein
VIAGATGARDKPDIAPRQLDAIARATSLGQSVPSGSPRASRESVVALGSVI